jgi:hypothetical protein
VGHFARPWRHQPPCRTAHPLRAGCALPELDGCHRGLLGEAEAAVVRMSMYARMIDGVETQGKQEGWIGRSFRGLEMSLELGLSLGDGYGCFISI